MKLGFHSVPVTLIGNQAIAGFEPNKILAVLQKETKLEVIDPSVTISLLLKASEAVEHAIRQMPDEQLDWSVPERKRTMREFTYHIFNHVTLAMASQSSIRELEPTSSLCSVYTSFQQIADHGKTVIAQFREWVAQQDINELREPYTKEKEGKNRAEQLDVSAGAVIQHLRQLYFILEHFGIEPKARIPDSEWPSEYILRILW